MNAFRYAMTALFRTGARTGAYLIGLSLAVALFSATLFFIDGSSRTLTQRAIAPVLLDFQARTPTGQGDITRFLAPLRAQPGVTTALPFVSVVGATIAGSTVAQPVTLFAVPPTYLATFPVLRLTSGTFPDGGVLVSEQLAVQRGLRIGDRLAVTVPGMTSPYTIAIAGFANLDVAEPLFNGPNAAPEGIYAASSSVIVLDYALYQRDLSAAVQAAVAQNPTGANAAKLDTQVQMQIARSTLPTDPAAAQIAITTLRHRLERQAPGEIAITDNLSGALQGVASDVIAARLLFLFLGLPGMLLAAFLSRYAAQLVTEAQRQEVALLRARGISPTRMAWIMGWTALAIGILGSLVGIAVGLGASVVLFGQKILVDGGSLMFSAGAALGVGLLLAGIGIFLPARRMLDEDIAESRRTVVVATRPTWLRLPLDLALLAAGGLAFWFSATTKTAGAGEGQAISIGTLAFLGPLLCWGGAALLFLRIVDWVLRRPTGPWRGGLLTMAGRSLHHRIRQSANIAVLLALTISFGVTTTIFAATYEASRRAESRYLVGSDLRVTPSQTNPQPASFATTLQVPGVRAVAPVYMNANVVLGAQTQTVYGVDIASLRAATDVLDSFFPKGHAQATLDTLSSTPNGILMSNELANAYGVIQGDTIHMKIPDTKGQMHDLSAQVVGIFTLFPTSSQNSDLIVNAALLTSVSGQPNPAFFLLKTNGDAATNDLVSRTITTTITQQRIAARVQSATQVISQDQSSLAGLNLAGLAAIDALFTALIIAIGLCVFLLGSIVERQREFGTLQAIGASRFQVTQILTVEAIWVVVAGLIGGSIIGLGLAWQYLSFLPGIFSVAAPVLTIPALNLGALLGLSVVGIVAAVGLMALRLRQLWPAEVLRDL